MIVFLTFSSLVIKYSGNSMISAITYYLNKLHDKVCPSLVLNSKVMYR